MNIKYVKSKNIVLRNRLLDLKSAKVTKRKRLFERVMENITGGNIFLENSY